MFFCFENKLKKSIDKLNIYRNFAPSKAFGTLQNILQQTNIISIQSIKPYGV